MTREEAIKMLKSKMDGHTDTSYEWAETVRMAIQALSQEPCGDCISRVEAMRAITDEWVRGKHTLEDFTAVLYNLPPVIPEQPVMTGEFITGSFTGEEPTGEWITSTAQVESEDGKT